MEPREPEESFADDRRVEISDLPGYEQGRRGTPHLRGLLFRPGSRLLFQAAGLFALFLFCLALLLSSVPGLRSSVLTTLLDLHSTPTAGTGPQINLLYVNAAPPWGVLSIDGKQLVRIPDPASGRPLRLGPGTHHLVWQAAPFPTRFCAISVPSLPTDTCPADETAQTPDQHLAWIVSFANSMLTLPRAQQDMLNGQIQRTLDSFQASDLVQPGEQFAETTSAGSGSDPQPPVAVADQPLHATLHLTLDSQGVGNACTSGGTVNACTINERRCGGLCTQSSQGVFWNVLAVVKTSWTYTTLDGRLVATDMADAQGSAARIEHVLALAIRWDGAHWHVQAAPQFFNGPIPCVTASDYAAISNTFGTSPFQAFSWRYVPAPNLAAGCLVVLTSITNGGPSPSAGSQILYLHRFGLFIAINHLAQEYNPLLPHPTPYELSLAHQLAAQAQIAFS